MKTGTLEYLDVKPGDVVGWDNYEFRVTSIENGMVIGVAGEAGDEHQDSWRGSWCYDGMADWHIISRAEDTPKTWGEMTDAEKGALLLAAHEGRSIEVFCWDHDGTRWNVKPTAVWNSDRSYRIKPEPDRETVTVYGGCDHYTEWVVAQSSGDTHCITYDTIDGKPVCDSVRMEEL